MGIPCVVFSHERASEVVSERFPKWLPVSPVFRRWGENIEKHVDAIVCASKFSAEEYLPIQDRVKIVPLGVDHQVFKPISSGAPDQNSGLTNVSVPTILFAGRMSFEKRPHVVLLAARVLSLRGVMAKFVIAGDGPMRRQLEAMADGLDVTFLGRISNRQELATLMASADLAIAPSPLETFGLSILEILACGTPVIVANAGAGMEIVNDQCGAIASPDGESMADAVETILKRDLNELRTNCTTRAADFSWSIAAQSMIDLFTSLTCEQESWAA
jgi:alpha-1,6-mannosyltransferase